MFIEKLNFTVDLEQVRKDLETILEKTTWHNNQIGLTYRPGAKDPWNDSTGSLYDRINNVELVKESEFTEFNTDTPPYLTHILNTLCLLENTRKASTNQFQCRVSHLLQFPASAQKQ